MSPEQHYQCLEQMFRVAPVNRIYQADISNQEAAATITMTVSEKYHHAIRGVHGSVYFKMLDDAAFFAANSLETEVFLLTTTFTTYLTRPVAEGRLRAEGRVVNRNRSQIIAESVVYDQEDREIGRGNGLFVPSKVALVDADGYLDKPAAG